MSASNRDIFNGLKAALAVGAFLVVSVDAVDASTVRMEIDYKGTSFFVDDITTVDATTDDRDGAALAIEFLLAESPSASLLSSNLSALTARGAVCTTCPNTLQMDLRADVVTPDSDLLTVRVSADDFMLPTTLPWEGLFVYSGNNNGGSVTTSAWWDPGNQLFAQTNSLGTFTAPKAPPAYSGFQVTDWLGTSPYSMTLEMVFDFNGRTSGMESTSNATLAPIPVPATLPLLLGGIGLLGFMRARRRG